ncbi:MAG: FAD-dependent oxidoreductase [Gammaproteobacteria bacterium]
MGGLLILGTGHAGYTLAREWRKRAPDAPLTLVTRDDGANYYKPNLSKAFASGKDAEGLIVSRAPEMAAQLSATVLTHTVITRIAPEERAVYAGERRLAYDQLVLALGAEPIALPLAGSGAADVLQVNDREAYARLRARLQPGCRVAILGAGLIGCEFANDLIAAGYRVTVADIAAWPLPRLLPQAQGEALREALAALGVRWHFGAAARAVEAGASGYRVELEDGSGIEADVVLSAVGLRAQTALARAAGLACGPAGISVDARLQTSAAGIFALGDCIAIGGRSLPYILPIAHASRALAATLAGEPTAAQFPAMPVMVKTPACPVIVCPPPPGAGQWQLSGSTPDLEAVFHDAAGQPVGFALSGAATARRGVLAAQMPPVLAPG